MCCVCVSGADNVSCNKGRWTVQEMSTLKNNLRQYKTVGRPIVIYLYSRTSIFWRPLGPVLITEVSSIQRYTFVQISHIWDQEECPHYRGVLISEVSTVGGGSTVLPVVYIVLGQPLESIAVTVEVWD